MASSILRRMEDSSVPIIINIILRERLIISQDGALQFTYKIAAIRLELIKISNFLSGYWWVSRKGRNLYPEGGVQSKKGLEIIP